jgi:DNA-binding NtrC family response regulator
MSATSGETRKLNLLVVDDERLIADSLAWILNLRGFNARSVYSGLEAINHAVINPIDILVSDVVMEGMSGIDAPSKSANSFRTAKCCCSPETLELLTC